MLFNRIYAFLQFSMLFNGNMRLRSFGGRGGDGWIYGWTDTWKFTPTGHRPFGAASQKAGEREIERNRLPKKKRNETKEISLQMFHVSLIH